MAGIDRRRSDCRMCRPYGLTPVIKLLMVAAAIVVTGTSCSRRGVDLSSDISGDYIDVDLPTLVRSLSLQSGVNISVDIQAEYLGSTINMQLSNAQLEDVLDWTSLVTGLEWVQEQDRIHFREPVFLPECHELPPSCRERDAQGTVEQLVYELVNVAEDSVRVEGGKLYLSTTHTGHQRTKSLLAFLGAQDPEQIRSGFASF